MEVTHRNPYRPNERVHEIEPHGLLWDRDLWYLVGKSLEADEIRMWRADRILSIAFSADGKLDDARRADITLGQLLCMSGGYTGEGGSPTAIVMGKAFPQKNSWLGPYLSYPRW